MANDIIWKQSGNSFEHAIGKATVTIQPEYGMLRFKSPHFNLMVEYGYVDDDGRLSLRTSNPNATGLEQKLSLVPGAGSTPVTPQLVPVCDNIAQALDIVLQYVERRADATRLRLPDDADEKNPKPRSVESVYAGLKDMAAAVKRVRLDLAMQMQEDHDWKLNGKSLGKLAHLHKDRSDIYAKLADMLERDYITDTEHIPCTELLFTDAIDELRCENTGSGREPWLLHAYANGHRFTLARTDTQESCVDMMHVAARAIARKKRKRGDSMRNEHQ